MRQNISTGTKWEPAVTSSSSKLNRVGRWGGQIHERARGQATWRPAPEMNGPLTPLFQGSISVPSPGEPRVNQKRRDKHTLIPDTWRQGRIFQRRWR